MPIWGDISKLLLFLVQNGLLHWQKAIGMIFDNVAMIFLTSIFFHFLFDIQTTERLTFLKIL